MNLFLTGGTGFIGQQVLTKLASQRQHRIYVLIRDSERFAQTLRKLQVEDASSIIPILGDLSKAQLGMSAADRQQVLTADRIIHAGGPMNIQLSQADAERSFLQPIVELAALASEIQRTKGLKQFIHLVGFMSPYNGQNFMQDHDGAIEDMPPYERMKFQADLYLRKALHQEGIPLSTVNPSVVIGDSFSGMTEQIGGLSILVDAVRRNLMPLAPGGRSSWIPMVHIDHAASFIANLANEEEAKSNTYYLLDSQRNSPNVRELVERMADELRMRRPVGSIPLGVLKPLLGTRIGRRLGIPAESMNFIVRTDFPVDTKLELEEQNGGRTTVVADTLPYVIADLDARLSHPGVDRERGSYTQRRRSNVVVLEREAPGTPVIFLHGTFSGAACLMPIADALEGSPICLVDLPGFGHSPLHRHASVIDGYVESVAALIDDFDRPVILIGHSFGALIAAKVMERVGSRIDKLLLMQPVLHPARRTYKYAGVTKSVLKLLSPSALRRTLLKTNDFTSPSPLMDQYVRHVMDDLRSPRIRAANAEVMAALTQPENVSLQPSTWDPGKVRILWGTQDRTYEIPASFRHLDTTFIPFGHQFPMEVPVQAVDWVKGSLTFSTD
ncbi:nucleoside-diphosphate-sugar epimerase/pimeloyl-ACP methyl ester carboxylesterase [Paenibacillus phyllosphaerae]|uniref:Nucleoside-diphosphate-sugar epimerase/pimeloyl-ACP methyl ester carboxylesterase n=1 Tax=Paenibacillus phyllosphaerae TaxID=274593 RepID=A0A7W5FRF6_9BACL|nr:alpha/beta fold hydrolase [Paenibacillus phyllosphaerae]MBB3114475.1 nucleoside-diphosphate-sugar epimerase/pimeloyl-ACP methyl ester carboxylesterase [Paenibacillus phyllosphaerae]